MVQKKFLGYIPSLMVRGLENIYADEAAQAVPEIFKEDIAAFGNKQIFDMVRVALDMLEDVAENRIRHTGSFLLSSVHKSSCEIFLKQFVSYRLYYHSLSQV